MTFLRVRLNAVLTAFVVGALSDSIAEVEVVMALAGTGGGAGSACADRVCGRADAGESFSLALQRVPAVGVDGALLICKGRSHKTGHLV
jgi:hypothetical protein